MNSTSDKKKISKSYDCCSFDHQTSDRNVEVYKRITEDNSANNCNNGTVKKISLSNDESTSNTKINMVQEDAVNDGADEEMLGTEDNDKLAIKRDEVKFIKGDHLNGDAKIDLGVTAGRQFSGMSKEELMKYANDPFWIRLRWIFFIAFWLMWLAMLAGAIFIIMDAPKCAVPQPLPWYKRGIMAKFNSMTSVSHDDVIKAKEMEANGVVYELPAELTYTLKDDVDVEKNIKDLVNHYKDTGINVVLDITPNYVPYTSRLIKDAMDDETKRTPFMWKETPGVPNNWLSLVNGSAWSQIKPGHYVLSQFGDNLYDLHMNDTIVKRELSSVLRHLIRLGVKGIRIKNSKFYLLHTNLKDEVPAEKSNYDLTQYGFWTHTQTTFHYGLGDLLHEYMMVVKNESSDALFTVSEDIIRPDVYRTYTGDMGVDIPMYGRFVHSMSLPKGKQLRNELTNTMMEARGPLSHWVWLQWYMGDIDNVSDVHPTAIALFMSMLPGIPIIPVGTNNLLNTNASMYKHIKQLRMSHSFMHGDFELFAADPLLAYTRLKSGNPGYFVVFNPTDIGHKGNFTVQGLPDKMTIHSYSANFSNGDSTIKSNILTDELEIPPKSTVILSYVPLKSG